MSFERSFVIVSYGLVGVAFLAVALSGELGWITPSLFGVAWLASLPRRTDGPPQPHVARIWTVFLFVAFGALFAWWYYAGEPLHRAVEFALLMTVSRLFQRRFSKDYLQLYALSFLLMLVAAVMHPSLTFAICFLIYAVLAIWALTMLHLVREIEVQTRTGPEHLLPPEEQVTWWLPWNWRRKFDPPPPDPLPESPIPAETLRWRRRRLIGGAFLFASSVMALGVLGVSMLFFFLFPRLGMGFFLARTRSSQAVVGFSDKVKLGGFGKLKTSAQVVMRVTFPDDPDRLLKPVRVRGVSFDRYEPNSHAWQRIDDPEWVLLHHGDRYAVPRTPGPYAGHEKTYTTRFYLEPFSADNKVLFAPPRPLWVEFLDSQYDSLQGRKKRVAQTLAGDLSFRAPTDVALVYKVAAVEPISESKRAKLLRKSRGKLPRWVSDRWQELPPGLDPRIKTLAAELKGKSDSLYDQARSVEAQLQRRWTYSLDGGHDEKAPLADFLFGIKKGHCEYFATSMVLMMRANGHAARVVNGFVGGEFNGFGNYRMIRQGDAHSWVEVYFPAIGWQTFDPTPPSGQLAPLTEGLVANMRRLVDGASMAWYTWVVEYDLERQVGVFRDIGRSLRKIGKGFNLKSSNTSKRGFNGPAEQRDGPPPGQFLLDLLPWLVGLIALAWIIRWFVMRRRGGGREVFDRRIHAVVARIDRRLRRHGMERQRWETWHLVAVRVRAHDAAAGDAIARFATGYDQARYAEEPDETARKRALEAAEEADDRIKSMAPPPDEVGTAA